MNLEKIEIQKGTNIEYLSKELLFLAQSGQPYRGSVYVKFTSEGETFNLLDFKKYITSLRSQKFYAENIAYEIYQTIIKSINTTALGVIVDLSARGGLQQRITYGEEFQVTLKENIFQV